MKKDRVIALLGLIVLVAPLLGLPSGAKTVLLMVIGLSIVLLSVDKRRAAPSRASSAGYGDAHGAVGNGSTE